ncbi:hypothetical protein LP7551_04272 [Roseibium album]|nr:hypothetical protein LP7551_04272 [Roseibium album]
MGCFSNIGAATYSIVASFFFIFTVAELNCTNRLSALRTICTALLAALWPVTTVYVYSLILRTRKT